MPSHDADETTDPDEYLRNNPDFAKCRKSHAYPHEDDVALLEAYGDPAATHEKRFVCGRCGAKKRQRFHIVLRRGRVTSYVRLDDRPDYTDAEGYLAKGTRISRGYVTEAGIRAELEKRATTARKATSLPRRRAVKPSPQDQRRDSKKAAVA